MRLRLLAPTLAYAALALTGHARASALASSAVPTDDRGACSGDDKVSALELSVSPERPRPGDGVAITFRFRSRCAAQLSWKIRAGGSALAQGTRDVTADGVAGVLATWRAEAGETKLVAVVDPENALGEAEAARANNTLTRDVIVAAAPPEHEPRPTPPPSAVPAPPPPPGPHGSPGATGVCTAWERKVSGKGEGVLRVEPARATPSGHDYAECVRRLRGAVPAVYCTPADRASFAKKTWYSQAGAEALVPQVVECR